MDAAARALADQHHAGALRELMLIVKCARYALRFSGGGRDVAAQIMFHALKRKYESHSEYAFALAALAVTELAHREVRDGQRANADGHD